MPHHDAASRGQLRALTALLRHKRTPVNDGVHEGLTALHLAASEDNHEVIEVLLAHAAHVDKRSYVVSCHAVLLISAYTSQVETVIVMSRCTSPNTA